MPGTIPVARQHLIAAIAAKSRAHDAPVPPAPFVRDYYRGVDESDLRSGQPASLAAAAAGHLRFGAVRRPGRALARMFNPTVEQDGWESPHTVVEVVTDDMPFLVDSLAMVLNASGLSIHTMVHPVLGVRRDRRGRLLEATGDAASGAAESWQHVEVDRTTDAVRLEELTARIVRTLDDVRAAVEDWPRMVERARELAAAVTDKVPGIGRAESLEAAAFLAWLADNHFTFLGYREYRLERGAAVDRLVPVPRSGLGLLRTGAGRPRPRTTELRGQVRRKAREPDRLVVTKANSVSTVHRATYLDYVGVKTFDARGQVTGERRFIGLFTSATYSASPRSIPLLRHKVQRVIDHFGISPVSHDGKALLHVLEAHPRDELFQASVPELVTSFRGIVNLYERRRVRMLLRRDPYQRFFSCLLYVPRDRYNTQARERIERILLEELAGDALEAQVQISESALARLHILVRTDPGREVKADVARVEARIAETLRTWEDRLRTELHERLSPERAKELSRRFAGAFPSSYQEDVSATQAIPDLLELVALPESADALGLQLLAGSDDSGRLHLRLYRRGEPVAMSDLLPLLENFDLRVLNERPYAVAAGGGSRLWIQDLEVAHAGGRHLDPGRDALVVAANAQRERVAVPSYTPLADELQSRFLSDVGPLAWSRDFKLYPLDADQFRAQLAKWAACADCPARFGDQIELTGVQQPDRFSRTGGVWPVLTAWRVLSESQPGSTAIFVHLLDDRDQIVAQDDRLGVPRHTWHTGDEFVQVHRLNVENVPLGKYRLALGLYNRADDARWAATGPAGQPLGERIILGEIEVTP